MNFVAVDLKIGHKKSETSKHGLVAGRGRIGDGKYAAGGRCAGGFYFFEQTRAAQASVGCGAGLGHGNDVRQLGAPATAFLLAGHWRIALGAASFHQEIMGRRAPNVQRETTCCVGSGRFSSGRFSCQRGEPGAILDIRWRLAKRAGAVYFMLLQSLTGNSNC